MSKWYLLLLLTLGLVAAIGQPSSVKACEHGDPCNRVSTSQEYQGTQELRRQVCAEVCLGHWTELNVGTVRHDSKVFRSRWWVPKIYNPSTDWLSEPLRTVTQECKTFCVAPGTEVQVASTCLGRTVTTGPITAARRYDIE